jgi:hypothetical protein
MRRNCFLLFAAFLLLFSRNSLFAQPLEKLNVGYSGTGITAYVLEIPRKLGIFRKNGLDPLIVYVGSGTLLSQALFGGGFEVAFSQGSKR